MEVPRVLFKLKRIGPFCGRDPPEPWREINGFEVTERGRNGDQQLNLTIPSGERLPSASRPVATCWCRFPAYWLLASGLTWLTIGRTIGARISPVVEDLGQAVAELGNEACPEFVIAPDPDD